MDTLSLGEWTRYRDILKKINDRAADEFKDAVWNVHGRWKGIGLGKIARNDLVDYAYELVAKYSEGAAEAACEFYDAIAEMSGASVPLAVPADPASYGDVAKTITGVLKISVNEELISGAVGRMVKQAGQDTTLQNAIRDGAEVAWIPAGMTCAFCLTLAGNGWQPASQDLIKNGHAEHIHANCDCAYAVRFDKGFKVAGYNPEKYRRIYTAAPGDTSKEKVNSMRREFYDENKAEINEQKRAAYQKRQELNSPEAEEMDVS